ncbi:MAG: DUF4383 domain-containing protein [Verrucomicrobia bacterium]|nr:DUF4383 domain-containing protein [Verrucomicrobiota bacterium]
MLSTAARIYGVLFLILGMLGFIPAATPNEHLFGLFHVNAAHNVIHLLTGAVALSVGFTGDRASKIFFLTFGIIYGLISFLGFLAGSRPLFGFMAHNIADAWLHLAIAAVSIFLGMLPETDRVTDRERVAY